MTDHEKVVLYCALSTTAAIAYAVVTKIRKRKVRFEKVVVCLASGAAVVASGLNAEFALSSAAAMIPMDARVAIFIASFVLAWLSATTIVAACRGKVATAKPPGTP